MGGWRGPGGKTDHAATTACLPERKEAPSSALTSTTAAASERRRGRDLRRSCWRWESKNGGVEGGVCRRRGSGGVRWREGARAAAGAASERAREWSGVHSGVSRRRRAHGGGGRPWLPRGGRRQRMVATRRSSSDAVGTRRGASAGRRAWRQARRGAGLGWAKARRAARREAG